jgi:hypothetical protein
MGTAATTAAAVTDAGPAWVPQLLVRLGSPAAAPNPAGRSPGRPKGRVSGPAPRDPVIKKPTKNPRRTVTTTAEAA